MQIKVIINHNSREYVTSDRQPVVLMKFLLLINNGNLDYIQFIAPHENWIYLKTNPKQVCLSASSQLLLNTHTHTNFQLDMSFESRYEIYRKLTIQAVSLLNLGSLQNVSKNGFQPLFKNLVQYSYINEKCRQCG